MITAVDTSVLLDVFAAHPDRLERSQVAVRRCLQEGMLIVSAVVVAELRPCFTSREALRAALELLGVELVPLSWEAAALAGEAWLKYRRAGGQREHLIPDFLIAAHALAASERLLTRDRGFYRRWFKELEILEP